MEANLIKDWMNFIIFSTTLCGNYENWKNNPNISEIINISKNPMCVNLKNNYPDVENKVIQSITLGFFLNMNHTILQYEDSKNYYTEENENYDDMPCLIDLTVD